MEDTNTNTNTIRDFYNRHEAGVWAWSAGIAVVVVSFLLAFTVIYAYDAAQTVDPVNKSLLNADKPTIYKFGALQYRNVTYSDGSVVPSATMTIQQYNQTTLKWETIGYTNVHLHKLKIDANDEVDISIGHTDRVNIKSTGSATDVPPPVID